MPLTDGLPIWFELTAPDPARAARFYDRVLGWTTQPSPTPEHGGYLLAAAPDGVSVAGMMAPPPGAPPNGGWGIYFATRDIAATLALAQQRGATILLAPMAIPHVGTIAILRDPQGVDLRLMQPVAQDEAAPFSQAPDAVGHAVWIELATPDPDEALAFYGALFGWTAAGAMPMGQMGDYTFLAAGDARPGAVMSSVSTQAPARWNSYVLVAEIDTAIVAAQAAGGTVIQGPDEIPGGDYSANILDPDGSQIGLVGPRRSATA